MSAKLSEQPAHWSYGFDVNGNALATYPGNIEVAGSILFPTGTVFLTSFGADPTGVLDSSSAWQAALNYCNAQAFAALASGLPVTRAQLFVPPGSYRIDNGATVANLNCAIIGAGRENVRFVIGAGQNLINVTATIYNLSFKEISTSGGAGVISQTSAAVNVQGEYVVQDCGFYDYTVCAIGSCATDMPYWKIQRNMFRGSSGLTSIGVALAGNNDLSDISDNAFLCDLYHIKLGTGGNNVKVERNDLIRFTSGGNVPALVDVWLVPNPSNVNAGTGLSLADNKFGNENLSTADIRILAADQMAGGNFITQYHATTLSAGYLEGANIVDNLVNAIEGITVPFIFSYTPNIRSWTIDNFMGAPGYAGIIDFSASITDERTSETNTINLDKTLQPFEVVATPYSTNPSVGIVKDSFGIQSGNQFHRSQFESGYDPAYKPLDTQASMQANTMTLVGATRAAITSSNGGANAATITFNSAADYMYGATDVCTANRMAWIELDIEQGPAQSLVAIELQLEQGSGPAIAFRRLLRLPVGWQTVRFAFIPRASASYNYRILPVNWAAGVNQQVNIGRPHIRHAVEPVHPGAYYMEASIVWTPGIIAALGEANQNITVAGCTPGDFVVVGVSINIGLVMLTGIVSAANTVRIIFFNPSSGPATITTALTTYVRIYRNKV